MFNTLREYSFIYVGILFGLAHVMNNIKAYLRMYACDNWQCGRCRHKNAIKGATKREKCGDDKKNGTGLDKLHGDWPCKKCRMNNFARNQKCFKCGALK